MLTIDKNKDLIRIDFCLYKNDKGVYWLCKIEIWDETMSLPLDLNL